jgi:carbamoyltransferase
MPFAPAMLSESIADWFTDTYASPFMMFTHRVKSDKAHLIGAVLHDDNTARVQTVTAIEYPVLHAVINGFAELTGLPMVLNTSFNIHGEPMVESPDDAIRHLLMGCVDCLVIDDLLVERD